MTEPGPSTIQVAEPNSMTQRKSNSIESMPDTDFNSRANLTEKGQLGDDYEPFLNRDPAISGNATAGSLVHLLKSSLGTGILAMPMAFYNAGLIFGLIGTVVVGFVCTYSVKILVRTSQKVCKDARVPFLSFSDTAKTVFELGPKPMRKFSNFAKQFVDTMIMVTYFGVCCVYIVFIGTSYHEVISKIFDLDWNIRIFIVLALIPCLMIGQIRVLKYLVPFSLAANLLIITVFSITLYYIFEEPLVFEDKPFVARPAQIPLFFATVVFAMEGIGVVMPVENSMKNPQHFLHCPGVLYTAMTTVITLYVVIGFFGYVRYGDEVRGSITLNLPEGEPLADTAKLLMGTAIMATFGLQFFVPNQIFWGKISHKFNVENHGRTQVILRCCIIILMGAVAVAIPELGPFISLVGAVCFSLLGLFCPSFIELVYMWPDMGCCKWRLVRNCTIMFAAICFVIAGATASIFDIVALYT